MPTDPVAPIVVTWGLVAPVIVSWGGNIPVILTEDGQSIIETEDGKLIETE